MTKQQSFSFFGQRAVQSLRDAGYRNTAYALGELVDNSLQEGATHVDILVAEERVVAGRARHWRVKGIGVLDNGNGMDATVLRRALRIGDGTRFEKPGGMGKFGVGLPQASISQCQRVDVWSWQNGPKKALNAHIDLTDPAWIAANEVPKPSKSPLPEPWAAVPGALPLAESGTFVLWTKLDRLKWVTSRSLFTNSERLIGRMYRYWLHGEAPKATIRMIAFDAESKTIRDTWMFRPNDPLYLMEGTSVDRPPVDPMFEKWGEPMKLKYNVDGRQEVVTLRFSIAKKKARAVGPDGVQAGKMPHGHDAKRNRGLSIVREGRELDLDTKWVRSDDPRERWWGAEVSFGRGLDEIFGVTNNKQNAHALSDFAAKDFEDLRTSPDETRQAVHDRLKNEDFTSYILLDVSE